MSDYQIYFWDYRQHQALLSERVKDIASAEQVYRILSETPCQPNPRFIRLTEIVNRSFPAPGELLSEEATDDEIEAYHDMEESIFLESPLRLAKKYQMGSAWEWPVRDAASLPELMRVVFPLARQLGIDIYDREAQIYLPAGGVPVPEQDGSVYLLSIDQSLSTPEGRSFENSDLAREALLQRITPVLAELGFQFTPAGSLRPQAYHFVRQTPLMQHSLLLMFHQFYCSIVVKLSSVRYKQFMESLNGHTHNGQVLSLAFDFFRYTEQCDSNHHPWQTTDDAMRKGIANNAQIDWLISDLKKHLFAAQHLFDEPVTSIKRMDYLYNATYQRHFPLNYALKRTGLLSEISPTSYAIPAVFYGKLAGNEAFETIVESLRGQLEGQNEESRVLFERAVHCCANLFPVDSQQPA